jgi:hypothetical protein
LFISSSTYSPASMTQSSQRTKNKICYHPTDLLSDP